MPEQLIDARLRPNHPTQSLAPVQSLLSGASPLHAVVVYIKEEEIKQINVRRKKKTLTMMNGSQITCNEEGRVGFVNDINQQK